MSISKEQILSKVMSYDILNFYLKPYHNQNRLMSGHNISNPFLSEKQQTPSFNIFPAMPGTEWRYKDFATGDDGSCFDLVMKLYNLSFPEALQRISDDFNLNLSVNKTVLHHSNYMIKPETTNSKKRTPNFSINDQSFSQSELDYWNKFGINTDTLNRFNVKSIKDYTTVSKIGNPYSITSSPENPIFAYKNDGWYKLYKPLDEKQFKFQYLGNKPSDFIFGWAQLPDNDKILLITGGEKDVMTLSALGYNAITLNSETANLNKDMATELNSRFENVVVLYDIDQTGKKQSEILATTHGFYRLELPEYKDNLKDISDFVANGWQTELLKELINTTISLPKPQPVQENKVVYNAVELLALGNIEPKYLINPIFPQKGTAVIAGKPDTGKSQFARQFCIHVALGLDKFIGFDLNLTHQNAIYVATEDNMEATTYLMSKQLNGLEKIANERLRFIFGDALEQNEIIENLENELIKQPADLVIVDSFGDIFRGTDSNNNVAMRNTVKSFDKIAQKHNCLILFVHHINKGAYRQTPGQEHIQGGAGLMQKVRLGIQMSEGEGNIRFFTVVKGNYCPKVYKDNTIELEFSEENFLFTNTGNLIPTSEIGQNPFINPKEEKYNDLLEIAEKIFGDNLLSYGTFTKKFCEETEKSAATAKRVHRDLVKFEIISKFNGLYRLTENSTDENSTDDMDSTDDVPF